MKNNKGFTLVELIIVVAIIAILSAVLAPQYLQYVERSRESNDIQLANNLIDAAVLAVADPKNEVATGGTGGAQGADEIMVIWNTQNAISGIGANEIAIQPVSGNDKVIDAIEDVMGATVVVPQSEKGIANALMFRVNVVTGQVTLYQRSGQTQADTWISMGLDYDIK